MEIDVRGGSKMILDYFVARTNPVDDFLCREGTKHLFP